MALRQLTEAPKADDYTPLQQHQEQTPSTFFGSKPVLYAHYSGLTLAATKEKLLQTQATSGFQLQEEDADGISLAKDVDIWVNSENLVLFQNSPTPAGVSIPYPSIALHATLKWKSQVDALFINVSLNDAETVNEDDDIQTLDLYVLPPKYDTEPETACIKEIFTAMNTCADLHPDPDDSDMEQEFDETAPGATGWITAENMDEYLDEDGNFKGPVLGDNDGAEELGPGAGTVRAREDDDEHPNGVNGDNADGETKWQRTG
ncbi:hypothetical protein BU24DRAFT_14695 [Aaosphaeria arxii CBS 175.79]|uniref:Benzoylformate decarboxylase n=1 Tax=Aaosphaeria arxii CBS 175.79 TaxID=1450172 RepID=A0A6A5Y736_9PLEO|nr:uncharacterized protein BU24DRAFT_14695 [Aaosphaeria arxii CBS 175.79]KAF2021096.1 hypothetical protein BU24DRAFT_14695 [Aaosphaeria arxii CBS 175.79]